MTAYDPRRWLNRGPIGWDPLGPFRPGAQRRQPCPACGRRCGCGQPPKPITLTEPWVADRDFETYKTMAA